MHLSSAPRGLQMGRGRAGGTFKDKTGQSKREPGSQPELFKAIGRYEFVPFFYCSDGFLWLGFLKSKEQCLKKKSTAGVGGTVSCGWEPTALAWCSTGHASVSGAPHPRPCVAFLLFSRSGGSRKAVNTVGGFEVQQILNESKVFFLTIT